MNEKRLSCSCFWNRPLFTGLVLSIVAFFEAGMCLGQTVQSSHRQDSSLAFGESQLNLFLHDRPQLRPIVQKKNRMWNWLRTAFGDTSQGIEIYWDGRFTSNLSPQSSESTFPDQKKVAYIRVDETYKSGPSMGLKRPPEEILSGLVFELNNVKHWAENQEITRRAEAGTINREEYIRACAETEYFAARETADCYTKIWFPYCQTKNLSPTPGLWGEPLEATFEERLEKYPRTFWYPWKYYGDRFDWITAQREGDVRLRNGDLNGAIADYTHAIKLGPRSYCWRGIAEMAKGDWDKSFADITQGNEFSLDDSQTKDFTKLRLWLIKVQRGEKEASNNDLNNYLNNRSERGKNDWVSTIGKFLLNQISEGDFLAAASTSGPKANQAQLCEAWYYAGMIRFLAGDQRVASQYFHKCLTTNQTDSPEYVLARAELKVLEQSK